MARRTARLETRVAELEARHVEASQNRAQALDSLRLLLGAVVLAVLAVLSSSMVRFSMLIMPVLKLLEELAHKRGAMAASF